MKKLLLLLSIFAVYTGCSSPSTTQTVVDSTVKTSNTVTTVIKPTPGSYHFVLTEGKDTTRVDMIVNNGQITGIMNWMPYEKDARKGKLAGQMNGDTAHLTWNFMQEGMADTLALNFLLQNGQLSQKPLKLNTKTGREQTDESAVYTLKYQTTASSGK